MSKIDLTNVHPAAVTLGVLGGLASIVLVVVWAGFWSGLTLSVLWSWFVSPLFGLPTLSLLQAYGIALVFRAARGIDTKKTEPESFGAVVARALIWPPLAAGLMLGTGWVVKSWM